MPCVISPVPPEEWSVLRCGCWLDDFVGKLEPSIAFAYKNWQLWGHKEWDIYHINWLAGFLPSTVGIQSPCQRMIFGWFFFITSRNTQRSFIGSMTPFSVSVIGCLQIHEDEMVASTGWLWHSFSWEMNRILVFSKIQSSNGCSRFRWWLQLSETY